MKNFKHQSSHSTNRPKNPHFQKKHHKKFMEREENPKLLKKGELIKGEMKFYGFHACLNLWKSRPSDIIKVYVEHKKLKEVAPLLKWCAKETKAYHLISGEEMEKVSGSVHHEGLCVVAKEPVSHSYNEMIKILSLDKKPSCLIYLDGVQNPHNIGSIMRVAAHFGVKYILGERALLPKVSPSAYRVAQGGAEHVHLVPLDEIGTSFKELEKLGFQIIASSSHGGKSLYCFKFPLKSMILMGSESEGVKSSLLKASKETVLIPGTGVVESLNVSLATGLMLGEYFRQIQVIDV